jgi:hypothetical protein
MLAPLMTMASAGGDGGVDRRVAHDDLRRSIQ